jgi:hypothetical protein
VYSSTREVPVESRQTTNTYIYDLCRQSYNVKYPQFLIAENTNKPNQVKQSLQDDALLLIVSPFSQPLTLLQFKMFGSLGLMRDRREMLRQCHKTKSPATQCAKTIKLPQQPMTSSLALPQLQQPTPPKTVK